MLTKHRKLLRDVHQALYEEWLNHSHAHPRSKMLSRLLTRINKALAAKYCKCHHLPEGNCPGA